MRHGWLIVIMVAACGGRTTATEDAGMDGSSTLCGNGVIDNNEDCDDGDANGAPGAKCTTQCDWVCEADSWCDDDDPCTGSETCVDHACVAGTASNDGVSCGGGKLCRNAVCSEASCGDQFVTGPDEECDDANAMVGDGCETDCTFSCVTGDSARDCTPSDPCKGQGTCNDTTHVCSAGSPLADNASCGTGKYCKSTVCTTAVCGNGQIEPGETCDLGIQNGLAGSGCKANCTYQCVNAATDCGTAPACQRQTCNASHACAAVADTTKNGQSCGTNLVCSAGACVAPTAVCGNGTVETGEQCDLGSAFNGANTGCETNCQFSCTMSPTDSCNDGNACDGTETCTAVTVNSRSGRRCNTTTPPVQGSTCGTGQICLSQVCVTSSCGDGFVSAANNEQCEPPSTATCSATCRSIVCGDGVRAGAEQCDDSNTTNLDGCNSGCKFEQVHRVKSLSLGMPPSTLTSTFCTKNQLGSAITGGIAQGQLNDGLTNGVRDGSITIAFKVQNLDDLTGTADPSLSLGFMSGVPVAGTGYDGTNDIDWWYTTAAASIDAMRNPLKTMGAALASKVLTGGPSDVTLIVSLVGSVANLDMLHSTVRANVGNASTPTVSTGTTPGHLATENLNPALTSFATMTAGEMCGDVTALSLANVGAPAALVGCNFPACSQCYTAQNSLLDIIVGGCSIFLVGTQIKATQPDTGRVTTDRYVLTVDSSKRVNGCTKNGVATPLATCLDDAAYSSLFRFTTERVIAK